MAEQLVNEFTVNRPIDEAWPIITDVEKIAPCLPGAQLQEIAGDDDHGEVYRGVVKVKLGAISTQFKGDAFFTERDDENYRAVIKGNGRDTGGRGNASADIAAQAESLSPTSTKVVVTTDLHITGKVAQFGRGILGDVSSKLIDQFSANLNQMIDEDGLGSADDDAGPDDDDATASSDDADDDAGSGTAPVADRAPTDGSSDNGSADNGSADEGGTDGAGSDDGRPQAAGGSDRGSSKESSDGPSTPGRAGRSDTSASTSSSGSASSSAGPGDPSGDSTSRTSGDAKVRKINGPAAEPIDLMGVSGSSILKRAAPAFAALLVVLFFLRRRRS